MTRRMFAWGVIWACLVAMFEALGLSPERWQSPHLLLWWLTYWVFPLWCFAGALLLWLAKLSERRGRRLAVVVPLLAVCPLAALLQP